jgi:hypothetical protein
MHEDSIKVGLFVFSSHPHCVHEFWSGLPVDIGTEAQRHTVTCSGHTPIGDRTGSQISGVSQLLSLLLSFWLEGLPRTQEVRPKVRGYSRSSPAPPVAVPLYLVSASLQISVRTRSGPALRFEPSSVCLGQLFL